MWIAASVLSAFFAGITAILAKCAIKRTDSDVATAIRTAVVLVFSLLMVLITGSFDEIRNISARSVLFLVLSGLSTGASWLCYFKALSMGDVNKVVPIDKSSTIISILFAIIIFQEMNNLLIKLLGTVLLSAGIFLMVEKTKLQHSNVKRRWIMYAVLSALFAALTSILAKIGIENVESNLATAIRTCVVLIMAWLIVFLKGKQRQLHTITRKELFYICISGIATGASWLCYYYAIQNGLVSIVVPIDKLSIVVSIIFSYIVFKEKLSKKAFVGLILMISGTLLMTIFA